MKSKHIWCVYQPHTILEFTMGRLITFNCQLLCSHFQGNKGDGFIQFVYIELFVVSQPTILTCKVVINTLNNKSNLMPNSLQIQALILHLSVLSQCCQLLINSTEGVLKMFCSKENESSNYLHYFILLQAKHTKQKKIMHCIES